MLFFKPKPIRPLGSSMNIAELLRQPNSHSPRKVSFHPLIKVVLIPTIDEYIAAEIDSKIWTSNAEYNAYKQQFNREFRAFAQKNENRGKTDRELLELFDLHELSQHDDDNQTNNDLKAQG